MYFGSQRRDLNKIGKPVDRAEWLIPAPTVNAYYDPQMNDINFPAGVLEPPLFDFKPRRRPQLWQHWRDHRARATHGFDDEGRQFDASGNLQRLVDARRTTRFPERVQLRVAINTRSSSIIDDIKINSKLTLGEDLADLGGTLLAYLAWKRVEEGAKSCSRRRVCLPISASSSGWRNGPATNERDGDKRLTAITNPHSPGRGSNQRRSRRFARVRQGLRLQSRRADGPQESCRVW